MKTSAAGRSSIPIFLSLLFLLTLSGCSAETKASFLHLVGIMSDEDYQTYVQLVDDGKLDPDNIYAAPELEDDSELLPPEGSTHVTFAENSYMDTHYYRDADFTEPIDPKWCYLMPGDCIYAPEPDCNHPSSQWYRFDRFSIYAYDESGRRLKELSWGDEADSMLVLCVPADQTVREISVIPLGKYEKRTLELTDYYTDSTGHHQKLEGTWIVNDAEVSTGRIEVSPVGSLSIDYKYDDTKYAYVESNPSSFYHEKGLVRFEVTSADQDINQYSVELRSLEGMFAFDASQYPVENGTVTFWYNGIDITKAGTIYIRDGDSLTYTLTPASGYHASENTAPIVINADASEETVAAIKQAIIFYPDKNATVHLLQPDMGGAIIYTANGRTLSGETCTLLYGTVITMDFKHWDGWIVNPNATKEYTVKAVPNQAVSIDGSDLAELFTEAESHKPELHVVVSNDMKDATFAISTSDHSSDKGSLNYAGGSNASIVPDLLGQNDREIFSDKIGTGSGIQLTIANDAPSGGDAIKLEITTKDSGKTEHKTIRYITDLSQLTDPIQLYTANQRTDSSIRYERVTIKISKVNVSKYAAPTHPHTSITVKLVDGDAPLQNGDVLESSREVEITITPDTGYYIEGSKSNNGTYSEKMKYSKWEKESAKILEKHPAQKLWYVTLDTSDSYGTCVYKLDGAVRSGRVPVRKGQKLTLEYTITDPNYQIVRAAWAIWESTETKTVTISIDESLDGQTIQRSNYITVEQKEG